MPARISSHRALPALALAAAASSAQGQYAVTWSAVTCGSAPIVISAGSYTLRSSLGQPLAGPVGAAGGFALKTGFLVAQAPPPCYANCDSSTAAPVLNVADFTCFLQKYAAADPFANCDGSTTAPVLNVADFTCFLQKYAAGCQ
jgi:hypothetical protein